MRMNGNRNKKANESVREIEWGREKQIKSQSESESWMKCAVTHKVFLLERSVCVTRNSDGFNRTSVPKRTPVHARCLDAGTDDRPSGKRFAAGKKKTSSEQ